MAVTVSHPFNCAIADVPADAAAGKVLPSHWNASHTVTNALDKTGDTMTGALAINLGTITVSTPAWSATQTWNAGAVTFTGHLINVTDTASAAGSLLADWQVGGVSMVSIKKSGVVTVGSTNAFYEASAGTVQSDGNFNIGSQVVVNRSQTVAAATTKLRVRSSGSDTGSIIDVEDPGGTPVMSVLAGGAVRVVPTTVAGLTSAVKGARSFVTDATQTMTAGIGTIVAGTGANNVPVYYDGTNWRIG